MTFAIRPATFDGTSINDTNYESKFLRESAPLVLITEEPIEVVRAGDFPISLRSQPQSIILPMQVQLRSMTQAALNALKTLFDTQKGDVILTATDGTASPITYRLTVRTLAVNGRPGSYDCFIISLYVAHPVWESDTEHTDTQTKSASPATWNTVTNAGTKRAYPVIEIKPTAAKAHSVDYLRRWPVSIASRTPLDMVDTLGGPYPIDVADNALDTDAENTAGRIQGDLDDLRVLVNGIETRRDVDPAADDATTKVWVSIPFKPMLRATLAADMTAVAPANGGSIAISNANGLVGWPLKGFVLIGTECIYFGDRTDTEFLEILRGSRGTTAAIHTAGVYLYRVQHDIQVLSDYTAATEPNGADVDRKPVIDLAASTNLKHVYPGPLTAPGTLRPGQFLPEYTNDNLLSPAISLLDSGAAAAFRDTPPSAAAPQFNNLELYTPCGIKAAAGAIKHGIAIEDILVLDALGLDMGGYESLLAAYNSLNDGAAVTITPAAVLSRLRYRANTVILTGNYAGTAFAAALLNGNWTSQQFVLDNDSDILAIVFGLTKIGSPTDDLEFLLAADTAGVPGNSFIMPITIPIADVPDDSLGYVSGRMEQVITVGYYAVPKGTYWARVRRTDLSVGQVWLAGSPSKTYRRGKFIVAQGLGPWGPKGPTDWADGGLPPDLGSPPPTPNTWSNLANLASLNAAYATCTTVAPPGNCMTNLLEATDFDFAIPGGTTIQSIKVEIWGQASGACRICGLGEFLGMAGNSEVFVLQDIPAGTDGWITVNSWSLPTVAEINAVGFGISMYFYATTGGNPPVLARTFSFDYVRITVYGESGYEESQVSSIFAICGRVSETANTDAPAGSGAEVTIDNGEYTFDNATPLTPLIVRGAQETIYHLNGVLKNDDTGQEIALAIPMALNDILRIDTYNKRIQLIPVSANDPTIDVPWAAVFSDEADWLYLGPGAVNLRLTETGMGTLEAKVIWRDAWN